MDKRQHRGLLMLIENIHLHLRQLPVIRVHNAVERFAIVVEGKTRIADLPLRLRAIKEFKHAQRNHFIKRFGV